MSYIELSNVASIRVSKDPSTHIKVANVSISNIGKNFIFKNKNDTSFVAQGMDGSEDIYNLEVGDEIQISMGYKNKLKKIFQGYVLSLDYRGDLIEMNCTSFASSLATKVSQISDDETETVYSGISYPNYNEHLFFDFTDVFGEDSKCHDLNDFDSKLEKYSFYNLARSILLKTPANSLKAFNGASGYGENTGDLATSKKLADDLGSVFGASDDYNYNTTHSMDLFENLNNVDMDYDVYCFWISSWVIANINHRHFY